jgi:hypothetical protein
MRTDKRKDGREFENLITEKKTMPVHRELEKPFEDLRNFLLDICGYFQVKMKKEEKDAIIADCEVTGIHIGTEHFIITGKYRTMDTKTFALNTPKIDMSDDYEDYTTVMKIVDKILEETGKYMIGEGEVKDLEFLMNYANKTNKLPEGFSIDDMKGMSNEELKDLATKILEKCGSIVMHNEEVSIGNLTFSEELAVAEKKAEEKIPLVIEAAPKLGM